MSHGFGKLETSKCEMVFSGAGVPGHPPKSATLGSHIGDPGWLPVGSVLVWGRVVGQQQVRGAL